MADLNLSIKDAIGKEATVREAFRLQFKDNISKNMYDQRDLDRLEKDDGYARCFIRTMRAGGDPKKAAEVVDEAFRFRKSLGVWDLTDQSFPQDYWDKNAVYYHGNTIDGYKILYVQVSKFEAKTKTDKDLFERFVAYNMEKHHRETPEEFIVCLLDMSGSTTSHMNTDISKFFITCFATYFPALLAYMINYELPTILSAIWSVVSTFMSKKQKGKIVMCSKKDIGKYVSPETRSRWPHMLQ